MCRVCNDTNISVCQVLVSFLSLVGEPGRGLRAAGGVRVNITTPSPFECVCFVPPLNSVLHGGERELSEALWWQLSLSRPEANEDVEIHQH